MPSLPVAVGCFFPSSSSDTTAHSDPCLPPSKPHRLLSFSFSPSPLPPREDKIADYFVPLPVPRVSSDAALPATPPYSTHYATLDYTNFRLSLSAFVFYILSLSLVSSLFLLALRASVSLASIHVSFMIPLPPAASSVSLARLHRGKHDRHSDERITQTRLRRVLCSFRQFNVTMSHERPIVRSDCQSFRQIVTPRFSGVLFHYSSAEFGLIEPANRLGLIFF